MYMESGGGFILNRCEAYLKALPGNASLIHRPENIRWLTGYTGEGCAFIANAAQVIITDFRYVEQAGRQAPECACERTGNGVTEAAVVKALCDRYNIQKLSVETDYLTHDAYAELSDTLTAVELTSLKQLPQQLRLVKDASEIACIRRAAEISCQAFDRILGKLKPGMTEKQAQILLDFEMLELGSERTAFDTIAAAGVNGSLPHATPSDHIIAPGELLTLDFGATVNGYCADMTRTIGFGHIGGELRTMYQRVLDAQQMALDAIHPGAVCEDVDCIARDYLDQYYPGAFGHSLGHGVGLFIHEQPRLARGDRTVLVPGHVVTIEPGVYLPGIGGCRIEDMAILTEDGFIDPITAPKQLIEL